METTDIIAYQVFAYLMGIWLGWMLHRDFGSRREKRTYYHMGVWRGLVFWAKVVAHRQRRRKDSE